MSSSSFVDYEVALLLAKYGKRTLLNALAQKLELGPDQLEKVLRTPPKARIRSRPKSRPSSADLVEVLAREHPNKANLLQTLHDRFANRTFVPELRDVRRFFERHGRLGGASKSRAESADKLFRLLAELNLEELETLCQAQPENAYSSLGLISDEILQRNK